MLAQVCTIYIHIDDIRSGGAIDIIVCHTPTPPPNPCNRCNCFGVRYRQHDDDGVWDSIFVIIIVVVIVIINIFKNL